MCTFRQYRLEIFFLIKKYYFFLRPYVLMLKNLKALRSIYFLKLLSNWALKRMLCTFDWNLARRVITHRSYNKPNNKPCLCFFRHQNTPMKIRLKDNVLKNNSCHSIIGIWGTMWLKRIKRSVKLPNFSSALY